MSDAPTSKELHTRAAESARETRTTIIGLATASIGGLFFVAVNLSDKHFSPLQGELILATLAFMVAALGSAIWFGYADAQWSYYWGAELDLERSIEERAAHRYRKKMWHGRKRLAELAMLAFFYIAALAGAAFVLARVVFPIAIAA